MTFDAATDSVTVQTPDGEPVATLAPARAGVDGGGDRLVSEPGLDVGERHPAGDQPRDVGVPQVVEPERGNAECAEAGH
jgi:hypothetical protein